MYCIFWSDKIEDWKLRVTWSCFLFKKLWENKKEPITNKLSKILHTTGLNLQHQGFLAGKILNNLLALKESWTSKLNHTRNGLFNRSTKQLK